MMVRLWYRRFSKIIKNAIGSENYENSNGFEKNHCHLSNK